MKKYVSAAAYTICAFALLIWGYTVLVCASNLSPLEHIIKAGKPTQALLRLFAETGIEYNGSLQEVVDATQKKWLRPAGKEIWEIDNSAFMNSEKVWDIFEELSLLGEVQPCKKSYSNLLFLGATYPAIKTRLEEAIDYWGKGTRWDAFVIFGGARPLIYEKEIKPIMDRYGIAQDQCPKTEAEMMRFVYENMHMPDAMRACKLIVIDAPMIDNGKGGLNRPSRKDTIELWLKGQHANPGDCLAISTQPFISYDQSSFQTSLPKDFPVEVVGKGAERKGYYKVGSFFDMLARILYQENLRMNSKQQ